MNLFIYLYLSLVFYFYSNPIDNDYIYYDENSMNEIEK